MNAVIKPCQTVGFAFMITAKERFKERVIAIGLTRMEAESLKYLLKHGIK